MSTNSFTTTRRWRSPTGVTISVYGSLQSLIIKKEHISEIPRDKANLIRRYRSELRFRLRSAPCYVSEGGKLR